MKRLKHILSLALSLAIALTVFALPVSAADGPKDFRAVWVSTIYNLDYPSSPGISNAQLKSEATKILDESKAMGMNAIILQVRPNGDALYKSSIYPWSQYLTGSQGIAPADGFDPLEYWVKEAHARGLELHAWINPYRVTRSGSADYNSLASSNPAVQNPDWVVKYSDGNYYLDPAIPEVRDLVVRGAVELVNNYDVDGIHMDDYFYPGAGFNDGASYAKYGSSYPNIDDWRRENVNMLVKALDTEIDKADSSVSFGISPFGIWANGKSVSGGSNTNGNQSYSSHYADTRKWVKQGWLDYICPQIYWEIGHNAADYKTLVNWWADTVRGTDVELYIGMADYKAGNSNSSSPWYGIQTIKDQIALNASIPEITGEVHFRYEFLLTVPGLQDYYTTAYKNGASVPSKPDTPTPPSDNTEIKTQYSSKDASGTWIQYTNGSWNFQVKSSGKNASGWQKIDGTWYYFAPGAGTMATGWKQINGTWYYLRSWGGMATGWLKDNKAWYYLTGSGAMAKDCWQKVNGKWYYFLSGGAMAVNTSTPDGCRVDANGVWIQ